MTVDVYYEEAATFTTEQWRAFSWQQMLAAVPYPEAPVNTKAHSHPPKVNHAFMDYVFSSSHTRHKKRS